MVEKDYALELELLELAQAAGRTDGDGPDDVADVVEVADDGE